jgi:hypothetical protein
MNVSQHINHLYSTKNKDELVKLKESLSTTLEEYNVFFDEYLEVFDDKMNASSTQDSPEWKAYRDKYAAYENVKKNIKLANYYLGMI